MPHGSLSLLPFAAAMTIVALSGAQFRPGDWYASLVKPGFTPPNWVFGPVWTTLYVFIAVAGWLVWRAGGRGLPMAFWIAQLVLNGAWSWLMFGRHSIGGALIDIGALWLTIAAFIVTSWQVSRPAALLFVPYLAWVTLATALNLAIWRLNS